MEQVFVLLGSNLENRFANLQAARKHIADAGNSIIQQSSVYETEPWGLSDQPNFINQVVVIQTGLEPLQLLASLQRIEHAMGRVRGEKYAPRTIDLDILFYGDRIVQELNLTIPHPHIAARRFTLIPLVEINPDWRNPIDGQSMKILLDRCTDDLIVKKITGY